MDQALKWQIKQLISKEVGNKLGIAERVEYEKIWQFVNNKRPCMDEPSKEFMQANSVNRELRTVHIWAILEEWEKFTQYQIVDECHAVGCQRGKKKVDGMLGDCPECEGKGFIKGVFISKTPKQAREEYEAYLNSLKQSS